MHLNFSQNHISSTSISSSSSSTFGFLTYWVFFWPLSRLFSDSEIELSLLLFFWPFLVFSSGSLSSYSNRSDSFRNSFLVRMDREWFCEFSSLYLMLLWLEFYQWGASDSVKDWMLDCGSLDFLEWFEAIDMF